VKWLWTTSESFWTFSSQSVKKSTHKHDNVASGIGNQRQWCMMMGLSKSRTIEPKVVPILMDVFAVVDKEQSQPQGGAVKQQPQQVVYELGFLSNVHLTDIY
jgi:hypothetical protein